MFGAIWVVKALQSNATMWCNIRGVVCVLVASFVLQLMSGITYGVQSVLSITGVLQPMQSNAKQSESRSASQCSSTQSTAK
eukprot:1028948-Pyramimonas_sp.AAC.1